MRTRRIGRGKTLWGPPGVYGANRSVKACVFARGLPPVGILGAHREPGRKVGVPFPQAPGAHPEPHKRSESQHHGLRGHHIRLGIARGTRSPFGVAAAGDLGQLSLASLVKRGKHAQLRVHVRILLGHSIGG
jgi:hypothetical protein